ncbi:uncharacterized protein M421DRAFT_415821 [Didymella exigua CBS 183.55]|uniref:Cytochrome P450 n=1 Tax=Didymella exigua CBS 183.55 TaxID=1150837 RepID=A0A6A5S039_9PLEO|nr:uncharacterized protein M421DRAFT_415821 [Didymella exigua CBS 183.55]KAF1933482.1 hypothetical protein M421DRAFT_415821 [Didymella exigua CBS 183.55]
MALKGLFVAVYASNGLISTLFLPTWYSLLLSPFTLAIAYYYGLFELLQSFVGEDFSWFDILPQFALSAVFLLLPTRLLSGAGNTSKSKDGGKSRIQSLPYWIPGVRHLGSIVSGEEEWLKGVRDSSAHSIISYQAAGAKHLVVLTTSLLEEFHKKCSGLKEHEYTRCAVLRNTFGMPKAFEGRYFELRPKIDEAVHTEIFNLKSMEALVSASRKILKDSLPDLITFNSSIVDQLQWERVANIELTDGTSEVECDFFTLINDFCCSAILEPLAGTQFPDSYQLLASDLADINRHYYALALGIPRLSPIQGLPTAALARKRLLHHFTGLFDELTNPKVRRVREDDESMSGEETDADTTTPLAALNELFSEHDVPISARAAMAIDLIHSIVGEVVPLLFWTLLNVYSASTWPLAQSDKDTPLEKIKEETKPWAQAVQPPSIHPLFPAPPEIAFASSAQFQSPTAFPYLLSCINETRRLYNSSATMLLLNKSTVLDEKSLRPGVQEQWELDAGSLFDIGLSRSLINSSSANFTSPDTFKPDRFTRSAPGPSIDLPGDDFKDYKTALLVSIIAGIVQLWDVSPAPKKTFIEKMIEVRDEIHAGGAALDGHGKVVKGDSRVDKDGEDKKGVWVLPQVIDAASVKVPRNDVRVRIRRRENLPAPKVPRKR